MDEKITIKEARTNVKELLVIVEAARAVVVVGLAPEQLRDKLQALRSSIEDLDQVIAAQRKPPPLSGKWVFAFDSMGEPKPEERASVVIFRNLSASDEDAEAEDSLEEGGYYWDISHVINRLCPEEVEENKFGDMFGRTRKELREKLEFYGLTFSEELQAEADGWYA